MSKTKTTSILTVGQMIDSSFGNGDVNVVNFKMLQTVLVLLARQMRLLNRQVALESESPIPTSDTNIVVSEIKMKGTSKKKKPSETRAGTSKSITTPESRPPISKSNKTVLRESFSAKLSMREFDLPPSTVWSSGNNSPERLERISSKSETTLRNEKYYQLLEKIEVQREKVLRVIQQRKGSRDEGVTSPSPMASMASTEVEFEKLLIVENIPEERETRKCLPLVTRDLFDELTQTVQDLRSRLDNNNFGTADFPDNMKLMQELRKGASLTEAMAALQISARLDATEKVLQRIASLVGDPGLGGKISPKTIKSTLENKQDTEFLQSFKSETFTPISAGLKHTTDVMSTQSHLYVTKDELHTSLDAKQAEIMGRVTGIVNKMNHTVEVNTKQARKLEVKIENALNMQEKLQEMERSIISYSHQLNVIDTGLTSQMTNLQEQLTHVQLDLESGLEDMTETLTNKRVDTEMLTELNMNFTNLQIDIERTGAVQRDLNDIQKRIAFDIDRLKYDVELLRDIKCDRDEVIDALRDKAGIKDLNGLVTNEQFLAAFMDFEKEMSGAYETFRKQEITWQKAINDIFGSIDEKVNRYDLDGLREDTNNHLNKLKRQIDCIKKILEEPLAASVTRRIYRDTACLSCANPAHIMPAEDSAPILPPLRPPPKESDPETVKPKEYGDHQEPALPACVAGLKITHPRDPRAQICTRYCGGAHTKKRAAPNRKLSDMRLDGKQLLKTYTIQNVGTDGKIYQIEEELVQKPCIPCNQAYGSGKETHDSVVGPTKSSFYDIGPPKSSHYSTKHITVNKNKSGEMSPVLRYSFTPSVPPMDQLSVMPSVYSD